MSNVIEKTSYGALLATEDGFRTIVSRLGLSLSSSSRIPQAYRVISELNESLGIEEDFLKIKERYGNSVLFSALYDVCAIVSILPFLDEKDDPLLTDKLKKICEGDFYHTENQNNVLARNTLFELKTLALLRKSGFEATLGVVNPDVEFVANSNTYFVECKRPSGKNLSGNIFDAVSQLEKKLRSDPRKNCFGVIAISLEYQFSPNKEVREIQTGEDMLKELNSYLKSMIEQYKVMWIRSRKIKDKRILGIMFSVEATYIAKNEVLFVTASYNTLTNIVSAESKEFLELAKHHSTFKR